MEYKVGQLVLNKALGLGKVLEVKGNHVTVFFKDKTDNPRTIDVGVVQMKVPKQQSDPWLDNLDLVVAAAGKAKRYVTHDQAVQKFLQYFPEGFNDAAYLKRERNYKIAAHKEWCDKLNRRAYSELLKKENYSEIVHRAVHVEAGINLLASFEKAAFREAVSQPADGKHFALGLFDLIYGADEYEFRFTRFTAVLDKLPQPKTPLRWTVQTIFPFLALPEEHLFMKPEVTQEAAERRAFSLNYRSQPNWLTYSCLLKLGEILKHDLAHLKPRDMIDIQSFIWVTGDNSYQ